ncbi:MAG: UDP-N-acetylmuramate dehydrogenase [Lachnospiraceae bacterium]|nr:UDP-N-acetylmuramate dehydrogenase [Lachnospiraceae bacterium]
MYSNLYETLVNILGSENVLKDEYMSRHTTFKVGGPADFCVTPSNLEAIIETVAACKKIQVPYYVIGNGSNLLVKDEGFRGVIIEIGNKYNHIEVLGDAIFAQAGAILGQVATKALQNELTGMEFAHGIPGSVGGAVVMNAGAYGGEIKDILEEATVIDEDGNIFVLKPEELELGYRHSIVPEKGYIVLDAKFKLRKGDKETIKSNMDELATKRRDKQPLEYPSAGSTFKRPVGGFAAQLIEEAGLKGYTVGGAQVSEKHSGFVINKGDATAQDVLDVIEHVKRVVAEKSGIQLETEVKIL